MNAPSIAPSIAESTAPSIAETTTSTTTLKPLIPNDDSKSNAKDKQSGKKSSGGWRSLLRSPASKAYDQVLGGGDPDKAKAVVAERDAASPSGSFVLGSYKPLGSTQGYADYYTARGGFD